MLPSLLVPKEKLFNFGVRALYSNNIYDNFYLINKNLCFCIDIKKKIKKHELNVELLNCGFYADQG